MAESDKCKRCGELETFKYLLWECREARRIWNVFNEFVTDADCQNEKIDDYDNIYSIGKIGAIRKIKIKVIQSMLKIDRPVNWTKDSILKLANELRWVELYNAKMVNKLEETKTKWDMIT
jgi:hypothetical protein